MNAPVDALPASPDPRPASRTSGSTPVALSGIRDLLSGLDRRQRQAVTHKDGPLLVIAGPGTGKTEVITRRIAWLMESRRARSSEILALTFTERAAEEMQSRVDLLVPYGQADVPIHTFHAFGDLLLREHGFEIGRPDGPRVIGRTQAMVLLRDHIFDVGLERFRPLGDPTRFVGALVDLFGRAKEEGIAPTDLASYATELERGSRAALDGLAVDSSDTPARDAAEGLIDEAAANAELARAYEAYQQLLAERDLIDHGDQVSEAVRLLDSRAAVRADWRRRIRYVVVDEAQDANPQQLRLVRQLVGQHGNVTFVGDDDQAIYAFRGAVGEGLASLEGDYDRVRHVVLRRNYRSRAPILEAARRLVRHNDPDRLEVSRGVDKTLTAVRRTRRPAPVRHRVFATPVEEADAIAEEIAERIRDGAEPRSIAVLVRTNADALPILDSLDVRGIARRFSGTAGLMSHREVRDVLSLMRVIVSPDASDDLYAVMTAKPYGLGGTDLSAICAWAYRRHRSLWAVITELLGQPGLIRVGAETRKRLGRVVNDVAASAEAAHQEPGVAVLYEHLRRSGWLAGLVSDAGEGDDGPLRRVATLFAMVREQADLVTDPRLATLVPMLDALVDAGGDPVAPDHDDLVDDVAVLTVHQAKGLEFATVYVVGLADGRFPIRARRDPLTLPPALTARGVVDDPLKHRAEERRLFYVAMTRARDELVLSHATRGSRDGRRRRPSPFLLEAIGQDVAEDVEPMSTDAPGIDGPAPRELATAAPGTIVSAGPLDLSFTQIDDYLSCPLKYRLRHQLRVPTAPNHALVFGSAIHQAVASVNLARKRGRPVDEEAALAAFEAHWKSEGFVSLAHEEARYDAGQMALRRFVESSRRDADRIVDVEQTFSVKIGSDRIRGRYDAVREVKDGIVITDYKSGDAPDPVRARERARRSLQLQLYTIAYEAQAGVRPAAVELHFLEGGVEGRVVPTDRALDGARAKVERVSQGIRDGDFEATPGFPACDWCPYRRICPASR